MRYLKPRSFVFVVLCALAAVLCACSSSAPKPDAIPQPSEPLVVPWRKAQFGSMLDDVVKAEGEPSKRDERSDRYVVVSYDDEFYGQKITYHYYFVDKVLSHATANMDEVRPNLVIDVLYGWKEVLGLLEQTPSLQKMGDADDILAFEKDEFKPIDPADEDAQYDSIDAHRFFAKDFFPLKHHETRLVTSPNTQVAPKYSVLTVFLSNDEVLRGNWEKEHKVYSDKQAKELTNKLDKLKEKVDDAKEEGASQDSPKENEPETSKEEPK